MFDGMFDVWRLMFDDIWWDIFGIFLGLRYLMGYLIGERYLMELRYFWNIWQVWVQDDGWLRFMLEMTVHAWDLGWRCLIFSRMKRRWLIGCLTMVHDLKWDERWWDGDFRWEIIDDGIRRDEKREMRNERWETRDEKRETRNERREMRDEKRETRNERRETRDEKRETRDERRETRDDGMWREFWRWDTERVLMMGCGESWDDVWWWDTDVWWEIIDDGMWRDEKIETIGYGEIIDDV